MVSECHRYRGGTRLISRVEPSEMGSSCHVQVVSPGLPQIMDFGASIAWTGMPCLPSGLIGTMSPTARF